MVPTDNKGILGVDLLWSWLAAMVLDEAASDFSMTWLLELWCGVVGHRWLLSADRRWRECRRCGSAEYEPRGFRELPTGYYGPMK